MGCVWELEQLPPKEVLKFLLSLDLTHLHLKKGNRKDSVIALNECGCLTACQLRTARGKQGPWKCATHAAGALRRQELLAINAVRDTAAADSQLWWLFVQVGVQPPGTRRKVLDCLLVNEQGRMLAIECDGDSHRRPWGRLNGQDAWLAVQQQGEADAALHTHPARSGKRRHGMHHDVKERVS